MGTTRSPMTPPSPYDGATSPASLGREAIRRIAQPALASISRDSGPRRGRMSFSAAKSRP